MIPFPFILFPADVSLQLAQRSDDECHGHAEVAHLEGTGDGSIERALDAFALHIFLCILFTTISLFLYSFFFFL